ncbi:neurensin-1 [Brienomyrus brachyistius]|uniref:neurensin-1 n=1 Tax=Brienomyrus brachyistius TaxID=42636 RepID=UPI0020B36C92|nr:neurensin-1 [Brienomyrus brachyistius]
MRRMASCPDICGARRAERPQPAAVAGDRPHYGVRSYLHQFYEECTTSIWESDEDFQTQRSPSRWSSVLWKVFLALGILILITGLTMLTVGYVTTPRIEAFGEDDLLFVDSRAASFNRALEVCKLAGAIVFCVGGSVMAGGFLLSVFAEGNDKQERGLWRRLAQRPREPVTRAPAPGGSKIPATLSKVQNVQPMSGT